MLALGSNLLVDNGEYLAVDVLGVPTRIVAITMVAIGTSLPELVTAITALVKKQGSMSVGNIIGANIIDLTLILPLCSVISGKALPILRQNILLDMPFCLGLVLIAVVPTLISGRCRRAQGVVMLGVYAAYIGLLCAGVV
jgi:cation:H+ antiporter